MIAETQISTLYQEGFCNPHKYAQMQEAASGQKALSSLGRVQAEVGL